MKYRDYPPISLHTKATEEDMVRICALEDGQWKRKSEAISEASLDLAMASGLAGQTFEWPDPKPLDFVSYADPYGRWCLECGSGVKTPKNQKGHVCCNVHCSNYGS